jgi:hypothetical protein
MNMLIIEKTGKTPYVSADPVKGEITINGMSIPENAREFYKPLFIFLEEYLVIPLEHTDVLINLEYFNTSTSKILLEFLKRLDEIKKKGKTVTIHWYLDNEDEDIEEITNFGRIVKVPFKLHFV